MAWSKGSLLSNEHHISLWHLKHGHINERDFGVLSKNDLFGERCMSSLGSCELGVLYKQKWVSFKMVVNRTCSLGCSHLVMWSLFLVQSHGIYRCLLTLKKVWVYFLEHSDEIFRVFKGWMIMAKKETGEQRVLVDG